MRYEDASGSFQASGPVANDDSDTLSAGQRGPATGNLITGEGTQYGSAGADSAAGAHITSIAGKGGEDSSFAGGKLSIAGEHGQLSVDAQGNYSYLANAGAPENVRDRFTYTLADNQGNSDTASLIVEIGKTPVVIKADAQQIVPGPDGVVTLPPGVELSDIMVVGRNLVINMPDGTQLVIVDGAVFVPQLVLDGVEVPASNVAALLIGQEPQPAAGETPPSSGGNFALPPPPLDPGIPLGDLIPPTEYQYTPPEPQEVLEQEDAEPTITIQPDGQPAAVNAVDSVDEAGLAADRDGNLPDEAEGSGEEAAAGADGDPSEVTSGVIHIDSPDGPSVVTINNVEVTSVGQQIAGLYGFLTITSISDTEIGYTYTLTDNIDHSDAVPDQDDFSVTVTDDDGDQATATLTINIVDDEPVARNDTDTTVQGVATGNVMTDAAPGDVGDSDTNAADTVGADDASLTSVSGFGGSDSTFEGGFLVVKGEFGELEIDAEGNYTYTLDPEAGGGGVDVFTYTLTDGDGDIKTATLTITNPDLHPDLPNPDTILLDDDVIPGASGNPDGPGDDDPDAVPGNVVDGQLNGSGGDGDLDYSFTGTNGLPAGLGFTVNQVNASTLNVLQNGTIVLTVVLDNDTGAFTVTQVNPIDHPTSGTEDNLIFQIGVEVEDADGDTDGATITINVDDDTPVVTAELNREGAVTVDESGPTGASTINFGGAEGDDGDVAGSGPIGRAVGATALVDASALFGADGPSGSGLTYSLQLGGSDTALTLTDGSAIELQLINGVIVGMVIEGPHSGEAAFAIEINPTTGVATVELYLSLDHPDTSNPNDSLPLGPNTVDVVVTATDGDNDSDASDPIDVSGLFNFLDDGPSVEAELNEEGAVTVDESGPTSASTIVVGGGVTEGDDENVAGSGPIGRAVGGTAVVDASALFGADGPAGNDVVYSLALGGSDTALTLTDGSAIELQLIDGVVVGVVTEGPHSGEAAFAIAINPATGVATVELYLSLDHPDITDPNDSLPLGPNTVDVVVTATDGDGDSVDSDPVDISGLFNFLDDGPSVEAELNEEGAVTVDESGPTDASTITVGGGVTEGDDENVAGSGPIGRAVGGTAVVDASALFGADGPAGESLLYSLELGGSDTALTLTDGSAIELQLIDGVVVGVVTEGPHSGEAAFAIEINPATGVATVELYLSLDHPDITDPNDSLPLGPNTVDVVVTATDGDGDSVDSDPVDISGLFNFLDDGPSVDPTLDEQASMTVDETLPSTDPVIDTLGVTQGNDPHLAGGLAIGFATSGVAVVDANEAFGADGPAASGDVTYALSVLGLSSGLTLTDGTPIELQLLANGVIVGLVDGGSFDGQAAFAIAIDANSGEVTIEQYLSLDHPDDTDHNDALTLDELTVGVEVTVTDGDGDSVTSDAVDISGLITFLDDGPSVEASLSTDAPAILDESPPAATPLIDTQPYVKGDDPDLVGGQAIGSASTTLLVPDADFGADGPAADDSLTYELSIINPESGLSLTDGSAIDLVLLPSGVVVGVVDGGPFDGQAAFAIQIDTTTGVITAELYLSLNHPDDADPNDLLTLAGGTLGAIVTATDGDGDTATSGVIDVGSRIHFLDDGPDANDDSANQVGEDNPVTVNVLANDVEGADGVVNGDVSYVNGTLTGAGLLVYNGDGTFTYTPAPGEVGIVTFDYQILDGDNDPAVATVTINLGSDSEPQVGTPQNLVVDEDGLTGANVDSNPLQSDPGETDSTESDTATGQVVVDFGNDVPDLPLVDSIELLDDPAYDGQLVDLDGNPVTFALNGSGQLVGSTVNGPVMIISITSAVAGPGAGQVTYSYEAELLQPVQHADAGNNENTDLLSGIKFQVTDSDNDTAGGSFNVTVVDDVPSLENVTAGDGVTLDESDASPFPISDISAGPAIDATEVFGADGEAASNATVYGLSIVGGSPEPSGLQTAVGNFAITLVQTDSNTIQGQYQNGGTQVAFTIDIGTDGRVTLTQNVPLEHLDDTDHNDALDLDGLIEATITITDGDGDTASASAPIGDKLVFLDDGPNSEVDGAVDVPTVTLDETRPIDYDGDSGDGDPAGLGTVTVGFASNFKAVDYGADGAGTTTYALVLAAEGAESGMYALDNSDTETVIDGYGQGAEILLFSEPDGSITGRTVDGGQVYFTISVNGSGEVTFTQNLNVWHSDTGDDDDSSGLSAVAETLQLEQTVTDSDGDTDSDAIDLSDGVFFIEDDGPEILEVTDAQGDNVGPNPSAEGIFDFDIGTDSPNGGHDDIFIDPASVVISINGVALDASDITFGEAPTGEDEHTAEYEFSFTYAVAEGQTDTVNGTLIFYKDGSVPGHAAGTYEVVLDDVIQGFTIDQTGGLPDGAFTGYIPNSDPPVEDGSQPEVSVAAIDTDLFVQFTGAKEPSGGGADGNHTAGGNNVFTNGELFSNSTSWVSTSGTAAGVAGDTMQGDEILDFNLYSSNPFGDLGQPPTQSASAMFLKFDGIGAAEDFIVVLKLWSDTNGNGQIDGADAFTTKAVMVQNSDIIKGSVVSNGPGIYSDITLDNNDGLVIIESNDYNVGSETWQIVGAQVLTDPTNVTGTAIDLNSAIGAAGDSDVDNNGSLDTQPFSTDTNTTAPMKISSIGFVRPSTSDQSVTLDFEATVTDADGDSQTAPISVTIGESTTTLLAAQSSEPSSDSSSFSLLASDSQEEQLQKTAANSNTLTLAAAVAAAGVTENAAAHHDNGRHNGQDNGNVNDHGSKAVADYSVADDGGDAAVSMLVADAPAEADASAPSSSSSSSAPEQSSHSVDGGPADAAPASDGGSDAGEAPAQAANDASPVAPAVAMVSAEALQAAAADDHGKGGSVHEVVADALGHGAAPTVDAILANLPGDVGDLAAISHMASPDGAAVSGWDMAGQMAFGATADMAFKADVAMLHHDAVQPAVNG